MKISYDWLKNYIEINKTAEQLADDLSLFGHEVEGIKKTGNDSILDFEITPNRGDCLSILGMAREIAALYGANLKTQNSNFRINENTIDKKIEIKIEKPEICPRFTARIIDNVNIEDSPKWMQEKLATYGFRPINNVVDITNFVMVATGQPLHAFDYDKIKDGLMNIRLSKKDEEVMTLDGQNRILPEGAIIIEDSEKIYDLAGIMGGVKSEVDKNTKTIVLQGAIFDPVLIRKASKYLSHTTDASYRYERGVDHEGTVLGVDMASSMIIESCNATAGELIDITSSEKPVVKVNYESSKINRLLGTDFSDEEIKKFLARINIVAENNIAIVPSYRIGDISIWQDLAEEVARIFGYNNLGKKNFEKAEAIINKDFQKREYIKDFLKEIGFTEIYSYSFTDEKSLTQSGFKTIDVPEIEKPISPETQYLRPSLLISLLKAVSKNPWSPEVNIFEIEKVFSKNDEWWELGLVVTGKNGFRIEKAIKELKISKPVLQADQKILDNLKIRRPVKYLIIKLDDIKIEVHDYSLEISKNIYKPISKFPPTVRDLSLIFDSDVQEDEIIEVIKSISEKILITELFDIYHMDNNQKSLAFHIWIQDLEKPMDEKETEEIMNRIIKIIENTYKAKLRSKE